MNLRKWRTNSQELLDSVPQEMREDEPTLEEDSPRSWHKVLGVHWAVLNTTDARPNTLLSSDVKYLLLYNCIQRRLRSLIQRKIRWWVHHLNALRFNVGQYHTVMDELKADPDRLF